MSPQSKRVVFVDDEYRRAHTRKRPSERACDDCRRKKRRCVHEGGSGVSAAPVTLADAFGLTSTNTQPGREELTPMPVSVGAGELDGDAANWHSRNKSDESTVAGSRSSARFIGDLNPEREFRAPSTFAQRSNENSVGLWHDDPPETQPKAGPLVEFAPGSLFHHCSQLTRRLLLPIMDEECLAIVPEPVHLHVIESFYFDHVHPILPAVDRATYMATPLGSASRILQAQAICLAAHANGKMRQHLVLPRHHTSMAPSHFARTILGAMRLNIELALTTDKTVLIRTLATMSLFAYTRDALELTCQFFNRAVHLMFTIGLHQKRHSEQDEVALDGLCCYVWALDRLHAAMQGRPVAIHERDMSVTPMQRSKKQPPAFRVFINIANLLDQVIDLYRPNSMLNEIDSSNIDSFEKILEECQALALPSFILETLELFYNAVIVLSCRSRTGSSVYGYLVPSSRQSLAASQIANILEEDTLQELTLLPHVPYAVSLSVSTAYRQIRRSQLPKSRMRARKQIHQNLRHLKNMSEVFWAAAVMAELTRKALVETRDIISADPTNTEIYHPDHSLDPAQRGGQEPTSRRQSLYEAGYITANERLNQFEWHAYQEPGESPLVDLEANLWDFHSLEGLLDANLELNMPTLHLEGDQNLQYPGIM